MLKTLTKPLSAGVAALAMTASAAWADVVLTYSSWLPWTHPVNTAIYIPWMEGIEAASEGRITFKRLPKPVASPPAHLDAVRTGQADVAFAVHGYSRNQFTPYIFGEFPFLGDSAKASSIAFQRTHDKFLSEMDLYKGVHLIGVNLHGPGQVHHSKMNMTKPADFEGQKIRTGGPVPLAIVEAWGGVSIRQPAPKSYEILSSGIADGITFPFESLPSFKITELVPYTTTMPGGWYNSSHYLVMNKRAYDGLTDEDKAVVDQFSGEAYAALAGGGWDEINAIGLEAANAAGNSIVEASEELKTALSELNDTFVADYIKEAEGFGLNGQEVIDYFKAEAEKAGSM
ncbi:TRAP dicarboxylate transporter-dctp subunit [Sulfitobacter noctilucicola]|uniref:TRAP-type C4-dicarboxylate transport system substrate-binding protein n=1 Tax=Sulfitobacter noctilucicola TaxID=1342301 RepID=A0A7W6MAC0_9RHOB|nr:TRAP transporter substrate-binding protein [Sulfitobacter noctilucicola]KIN64260.1 TRAP dicarboxylate transporter-dctp subunit [Sulfitobacter noctilucicola]MBB4174572.1 TRAP-type C4-dicarboxylate transport system substrate-binding protein [Sulfitobacter noctilucicola]